MVSQRGSFLFPIPWALLESAAVLDAGPAPLTHRGTLAFDPLLLLACWQILLGFFAQGFPQTEHQVCAGVGDPRGVGGTS